MIHSKFAIALSVLACAPLLVFGATSLSSDEGGHLPQVVPDAIHVPIVAGDHEATLAGIEKVRGKRTTSSPGVMSLRRLALR